MKTSDVHGDKYLRRKHPPEQLMSSGRGERRSIAQGPCVCVLVSEWSLRDSFGLEFKLSCRGQEFVRLKKRMLVERRRKEKPSDRWSQCRKGESVLAVLLRGGVPSLSGGETTENGNKERYRRFIGDWGWGVFSS